MKTPSFITELRDFLILWSTQSLSGLGTAMTSFALTVWVYAQQGTASSVTMLSVCSVLPSVLFAFLAGAAADRWDRKRIMLLSDTVAAAGTTAILLLYLNGMLRIWHLYLINFLLSCMNAFQNPASYVAVSLLVPRKHDTRVSGLQSLSGSIITILAPALGGLVMGFGGLPAVLAIDLATFAAAFLSLLIFIKIPAVPEREGKTEGFLAACAEGLRYLRVHSVLLRIILFFSFINFIAQMGGYGMLSPFVLGRTGGDEAALGFVAGRSRGRDHAGRRSGNGDEAAEAPDGGHLFLLRHLLPAGGYRPEPDGDAAHLGGLRVPLQHPDCLSERKSDGAHALLCAHRGAGTGLFGAGHPSIHHHPLRAAAGRVPGRPCV